MAMKVVCGVANLFVCMLYMQLVSSQLPSDQVNSMTSIYEIFQNNTGSSFVWSSVLKNSTPCSWRGVYCSNDDSSINSVSFSSFSVSTSDFLPFLCKISTLESIDVSNNQLSSIPDGFYTVCGGNSGLKLLNFSGNDLNGSLSSFSGFSMLENLDFSSNLLSGEITKQFDGLGSLKSLDLSWNRFTGNIPTNLGKMNVLEELVLSANLFTGEIPLEITKYKNLKGIDLSANLLSGSIPRELGVLISLQTLVLSLNQLTGGIPTFLANLKTLQRFAANQNKFNGTIPLGISSYVSSLDLSYNELTGTIPSDLLSGPNLQALDLTFNRLEGPIPAITSTKLFRLRLGSNYLNGTIPSDSLRSDLGLMFLELDGNSLTGEIPSELGMLKKLALLNLAENRLTGRLASSLGNLSNLQVLSLQLNNFVGEIPLQILKLRNLEKLNLSRNSINGSIPLEISKLQKIRNLDLQGNNLHGSISIPDSIGNLSYLVELQLGSNQLSGRIPVMPESLQIALNLSYNLFSGEIPSTLSKLPNLEVLDLSNNRFTGEVPTFLASLSSLTHLLLTNNSLSGLVPKFRGNLVLETEGNSMLIPSSQNTIPARGKGGIPLGVAIVISIVAAALGVSLLVVIALFISKRYYKIPVNLLSPNTSDINFVKALEAVADPSKITLKTRFSTYYKSLLPSGATYFIKKVNRSDKMFRLHDHQKLIIELENLGNLSNPNLMIPFAYLLTLREAYLFYDFAPRGTLFDVLHLAAGSALDWAKRYTIAIGVSQGLASLHQCNSGPILLLDLSSKSILLKSSNEPQIGDIELSSVIGPSKSRGSISTVAGSAGYIPPEYAYTMRVTTAGNVYSFGVVLLELLTGKPAVSEGIELVKWVLSMSEQQNGWDEVLDSNVSETSSGVRNQMLEVVEVALACVSVSPEMRPNMMNVLQMLLDATSN